MFSKDFVQHDIEDMEMEMERRCVALHLDCSDENQMILFAHELFDNLKRLEVSASNENVQAKIKVEIYMLAMLMRKANLERFGPDYMSQFDALATWQNTWGVLAKALWREIDRRDVSNNI